MISWQSFFNILTYPKWSLKVCVYQTLESKSLLFQECVPNTCLGLHFSLIVFPKALNTLFSEF